jgi:acyl carrier protein
MNAREDLLNRFHRIACEVAEKEVPVAKEGTSISDLGIDSLGMLEIIGMMEREFKIQIPDDKLVGLKTVGQLVDLVESRLPRQA